MGSIISRIRQLCFIGRSYYLQRKSFARNYTSVYAVQLGSFGFAQACCHLRNRHLRAVKAIDLWEDEMEEIDILDHMEELHSGLLHENIVRFYESFKEEKQRILSYELTDGRELFEALQHGCHYSTNTVRCYMSQILSAVQYCHDNNIIHRSLSPQRFMLVNGTSTVKMLNLYTAVRLNDGMLNEEYRIGNLKYCSPEDYGRRPYGKPADVYSCGLILYNMLSGIHPFWSDESTPDDGENEPYGFGRPEWQGVVENGKELLTEMLQECQDERMTATVALQHPFFTSDDQISHDKQSVLPKLYEMYLDERLLVLMPSRNAYDEVHFLLNMNLPVNALEL